MSSITERRVRRTRPWWIGALGWLGAVAWAVFLYLQSASPTAGSFLAFFPPGADKVAHAGAYGVLGALLTVATGRPWLAVLIAAAFGVSDEFHQSFVPQRAADVYDVVADTVGATIGAAFVAFLSRRRCGRPIQ